MWRPPPRRGTSTAVGSAVLACIIGLSACSSGAANGNGRASKSSTTRPPSRSTSTAPTTPVPANQGSWTTYGGSFARTSVDTTDPARQHAPVEAWASAAPDGAVYGEPLVYRGGVFVATENDTVYAYSATSGTPLWAPAHLATPAPSNSLPCGNISPTVGVTSTMVIDPSTGVLFASAETSSGAAGAVGHFLFAISTSTGKLLWSRDIDQVGWTASAQLQRAGLAISAGKVLVGFGGNYGDCGNYNGWVMGVPESGSGQLLRYRVPAAREGAIWGPAGITVDPSGNVFVATGNGSALPGQAFDHGDAVIELSTALSELQYFAPTNWAQDNADDADLGSTSPVDLGNGQLFEVGKEAMAYLLNTSSLGGVGGGAASVSVCSSSGASAYLSPDAYVVCNDEGRIAQVRVGPANSMTRGWTWTSPTGGASSPTIAGGVLWSIDQGASMLYGVDLSNGTTRFRIALRTGSLAHFVAPGAAGGMLVVAGSAAVEAFR